MNSCWRGFFAFLHLGLHFQAVERIHAPHRLYRKRKRVKVTEDKNGEKGHLTKRKKITIQKLKDTQEEEGSLIKRTKNVRQLRYYDRLDVGCSQRRICRLIFVLHTDARAGKRVLHYWCFVRNPSIPLTNGRQYTALLKTSDTSPPRMSYGVFWAF